MNIFVLYNFAVTIFLFTGNHRAGKKPHFKIFIPFSVKLITFITDYYL